MEDIVLLVGVLFLAVSFAYSSVGLGGGSSYTALMAAVGMSHLVIPTISLTLNLAVTTLGGFNYLRRGHGRMGLILPFIATSIPMSYVGGSLNLPKDMFYWILLATLVSVASRIYVFHETSLRLTLNNAQKVALSLTIGAVLGLIAGIVGIGGGIYLIPSIIVLGLGTTKEAAACGTVFVWLNSLSGLAARLRYHPVELAGYTPLIGAVVLGGGLGSFLGASRYSPRTLERMLGVIIVVAISFLAKRVFLL